MKVKEDEGLYEKFTKQIFGKFLKANDPMTTVLRGLLYFEAEIEAQLNIQLEYPDLLDLSRMKFLDKLNLLSAMGALPKDYRIPYMYLNVLKQSFVHDYDYKLQKSDVEKIYVSMNKSQRNRFAEMVFEKSSIEHKLRTCIGLLGIDLCFNGEILRLKRKSRILQEELSQLNNNI